MSAKRFPPEIPLLDEHNRALVDNVHPSAWTNPEPAGRYNLVVIGAGTAGLVTAAGAAGLGAKVALVERSLMGGDCLNVGCVPSKSLIRSSRVLGDLLAAPALGIRIPPGAKADFPAVMERMRRLRARISRHDSARRFQQLGVDVYLGEGRFTGPGTVEVEGRTLHFKRAVIATGARPVHPAVDGLAEAGFLTNETVFNLTERPRRLGVIGGGPIGCELAQAFRRLGCDVVLLHSAPHLLHREDEDAAEIIQKRFLQEGIRLALGARILRVERRGGEKMILFEHAGGRDEVRVDEILAGAGRQPNLEGLNLEAAGVTHDARRGVKVDDRLRTSNRKIYAAGDICLDWKFTHAADAAARLVIQNALFFGRKKLSALTIPWCTYTDPEIARVGLSEGEAARSGVAVTVFRRPFTDVDRAVLDGEEEGFVKILVREGTDRIAGATVVARHAGEIMNEITLAMEHGVGLAALGSVIHPYPTQAEAIKQAGDACNRTRLTPFIRRAFDAWFRWTR
jgi:pyruvate/2-oxoglutarate dehydrogenase complex dihydrolipoamide dehydrogenase (E3) component